MRTVAERGPTPPSFAAQTWGVLRRSILLRLLRLLGAKQVFVERSWMLSSERAKGKAGSLGTVMHDTEQEARAFHERYSVADEYEIVPALFWTHPS